MTKKNFFELAGSLHNNWISYTKKYNITKEIEPLLPLLNDPSGFSRTETQILDAFYNAALTVLESTPELGVEQKTRALYFNYNLCDCDSCNKEVGTHINKKGQIRISKKFFQEKLNSQPPYGLVEIMYTLFHQILHGLFPNLEEYEVVEKTERFWKMGLTELIREYPNDV
jgi:hypothetical protein